VQVAKAAMVVMQKVAMEDLALIKAKEEKAEMLQVEMEEQEEAELVME
jgi:hypothetical protein